MRRRKNITLKLKILISHFTGVRKIITLSFIILMLSFTNIILCFSDNFVSALSYQSEVGIGFNFNPTLSVSLSSSGLIISNLAPGSTADSNSINVSVATNASYGYTLSVNVDSDYLVHSNNTNTFSGIATDADLAGLTVDNTWGYSTSLDNGSSWSDYNGLSSSASSTLLDKDSNASSSVDFKIAAKAGNTQASGTYTNTITFTAVTKPTPITLAEAYASEGKTMVNGFYTMQDMTSTICSKTEAIGAQLQVLDIRDYKVYWIAKLADQKCWMTQNLDLDLDSNRTYTHWDTDLGWSTENGNSVEENATWQPALSTINFTGTTVTDWIDSNTEPYSANPGDRYVYTSNSDRTNDITYLSLDNCLSTTNDYFGCLHSHIGNYYNWVSVKAGSESSNSICPNGWKLPTAELGIWQDFYNLLESYNILNKNNVNAYSENGFKNIRLAPLYFVRAGLIYGGYVGYHGVLGKDGYYWSSTKSGDNTAYSLYFRNNYDNPGYGIDGKYSKNTANGFSVRCLAR